MRNALSFLRIDDVPPLSRASYRLERRHFSLWPLFVAGVEGNVAAIVAKLTFDVSNVLATIVWATPFVALVLNLVWGPLLRGRARVPGMLLLGSCGTVCVASIGFTPPDWHPWNGYIFAAQLASAHFFLSGLITLRTSVWKHNYPEVMRAQITSRFHMMRQAIVMAGAAAIGVLFDRHPDAYRYVYPGIAIFAAMALLPLRKLPVRGEARELRLIRETAAAQPATRLGLLNVFAILGRDPRFARYQFAQFLLGAANFFTEPVLIAVITNDLKLGYAWSIGLMTILPMAISLPTINWWATKFDALGVVRFRIINTAVWFFNYTTVLVFLILTRPYVGTPVWLSVLVIIAARVLFGFCRGGGQMAWTLGHLSFAPPGQVETYMSVHVALTGVRGLIMPLVGAGAFWLAGPWAGVGGVALISVAHWQFRRLAALQALDASEASQGRISPRSSAEIARPRRAIVGAVTAAETQQPETP
ncbi:MAG: hypothetical protein KDA32_10780 [Phycisphaerales bacterium]|nr:hypothetical protein [Phycisphaerales bacterium]